MPPLGKVIRFTSCFFALSDFSGPKFLGTAVSTRSMHTYTKASTKLPNNKRKTAVLLFHSGGNVFTFDSDTFHCLEVMGCDCF